MWYLYFIALAPILVGLVIFYLNKKVTWIEWLSGCGASLLLAFIFHLIAIGTIHSKTSDTQTFSGEVTRVEHHPKWIEEWIETHVETYPCGTDKDGNTTYCTRTYTTIEHDTHPEHWRAIRDFGSFGDSIEIDYDLYLEIKKLLGDSITDGGKQSYWHLSGSFDGGDNNIYSTLNTANYIYPVTINKYFKNKIKATPNIFQFAKLSTNTFVYPWPSNPNWNYSERLVGEAAFLIDTLKFDQLNSAIGPVKRVNLIMVGFKDNYGPEYGKYQEAAWIGGKKNDLVICFGGGNKQYPPKWVYVFGWTESEIVKKNIQTILLSNPVNDEVLPKIKQEIIVNYQIKDWKKFDYIKISPPNSIYFWYILTVIFIQIVLYVYFHFNEFTKENSYSEMDNLLNS